MLAPGVSYVTARPSAPPAARQGANPAAGQAATLAGQTDQTDQTAQAGCRGVTPAVFPAQGFITNPARTQGGHLWWRYAGDGTSVCIGTVVQWVQYNVTDGQDVAGDRLHRAEPGRRDRRPPDIHPRPGRVLLELRGAPGLLGAVGGVPDRD